MYFVGSQLFPWANFTQKVRVGPLKSGNLGGQAYLVCLEIRQSLTNERGNCRVSFLVWALTPSCWNRMMYWPSFSTFVDDVCHYFLVDFGINCWVKEDQAYNFRSSNGTPYINFFLDAVNLWQLFEYCLFGVVPNLKILGFDESIQMKVILVCNVNFIENSEGLI